MHRLPALARAALAAIAFFAVPAVFAQGVGFVSFAGGRDSSLPQALYDARDVRFTDEAFSDVAGAIATVALGTTGTEARAQTLPGVNRVESRNLLPVDDEDLRASSIGGPFSIGLSVWSDVFTLQGGSGAGSLSVSATIDGQFGNGFGASGDYLLLRMTPAEAAAFLQDPISILFGEQAGMVVLGLSQNTFDPRFSESGERLPPGSAFGGTRVGELAFVYGESFALVSVLLAGANDQGSLVSFNSARFGISAPDSASIGTASGFVYASAVPEPGTWLMLTLGLLAVATSVLRRRSARRSSESFQPAPSPGRCWSTANDCCRQR